MVLGRLICHEVPERLPAVSCGSQTRLHGSGMKLLFTGICRCIETCQNQNVRSG